MFRNKTYPQYQNLVESSRSKGSCRQMERMLNFRFESIRTKGSNALDTITTLKTVILIFFDFD